MIPFVNCNHSPNHNHDRDNECYSVLPTPMKTDSALQCPELRKQTRLTALLGRPER